MRTLMYLASVLEMTVVKRIFQNMFYRGENERFSTSRANQAERKHFALNCRERKLSRSKSPQTFFHFRKGLFIRLNRSQTRFVKISQRGFCRQFTTAYFLSNTAQNIFSQIVGVIFGLTESDTQHEFSLRCRFEPKCREF